MPPERGNDRAVQEVSEGGQENGDREKQDAENYPGDDEYEFETFEEALAFAATRECVEGFMYYNTPNVKLSTGAILRTRTTGGSTLLFTSKIFKARKNFRARIFELSIIKNTR